MIMKREMIYLGIPRTTGVVVTVRRSSVGFEGKRISKKDDRV